MMRSNVTIAVASVRHRFHRIHAPLRQTWAGLLGTALIALVAGQQCIPSDSDGRGDNTDPPVFEAQRRLRLETTQGVIVIELFSYQAPQTVANIIQYVDEGFYDGTIFHEARSANMVAAGRYDEDLEAKATRTAVPNESNNGLSNTRGRVALVEPDGNGTGTGTSAFLINVADNTRNDYGLGNHSLGQTVFGRVVEGMNVVDAIANLKTTSTTAGDGKTLARLPVETVKIVRASLGSVTPDENRAPIADAGEDQTARIHTLVVLDGSASSDPDADSISFSWTQTSGPDVTLSNRNVVKPTFTSAVVATLTFDLVVTDANGASSKDSVTVTVNSIENEPPIADAGGDQVVQAGTTVTLNGTGSVDPDIGVDGKPLTYLWVQTGGTSVTLSDPTASRPTFTAPMVSGSLVFKLTVTDYLGGLATDTVVIQVNLSPTVSAGADRFVAENVVVTLRGVGSDPDPGDTLRYLWRQTAGPSVTLSESDAQQPTFTVPAGGTPLSFEVTVTDSAGATAADAVTLTPITEPRVRLSTTLGDIVLDLFEDEAPITAANFLQYVEDGFYDGTIFHRVVNTPTPFVIQGGGFLPDLSRKEGLRDPIENEFSADRSNLRGTVAMAKLGGDPNSATSQFFINLGDNSENLDNQNGGFTVFATVIEGMDVVDSIAAVETSTQTDPEGSSFSGVPVVDVIVNSATLE